MRTSEGKLINNSPRCTFLLKTHEISILVLYLLLHGILLHQKRSVRHRAYSNKEFQAWITFCFVVDACGLATRLRATRYKGEVVAQCPLID